MRAAAAARALALALLLVAAIARLPGAQATGASAERPFGEKPKGDILRELEWHPGSDDAIWEQEASAKVFKGGDVRPPGHVFGIAYKDNTTRSDKKGIEALFQNSADASAALLGAQLVRAYNAHLNPADHGPTPLLHEYAVFLQHNSDYRKRLEELFSELDLDADGALSDQEINTAVDRGLLTRLGARALKTFDVNFSQRVSWQEFKLGPVFLVLLEQNPKILKGFKANIPGNAALVASLFRSVLGDYFRSHPAALGLIQLSEHVERTTNADDELVHDPVTALELKHALRDAQGVLRDEEEARAERMRMRRRRLLERISGTSSPSRHEAEDSLDAVLAETVSNAHRTGLFKASGKASLKVGGGGNFLSKVVKGAGKMLGNAAKASLHAFGQATGAAVRRVLKIPDPAPPPPRIVIPPPVRYPMPIISIQPPPRPPPPPQRYHSRFGVPSFENEACVICQFMYQLVETEMKAKVVDEYTAFDNFPYPKGASQNGGADTLDSITADQTGGRPNRVTLIDERGQRSPTRMIKNVFQRVLKRTCGETAPYLFRGICKEIWRSRALLAYSMYRRQHSGPACSDVGICSNYTYFNSIVGVHYPTESNKLNNQRGVCGMLGGPNARKNPFLRKEFCFVTDLSRALGILPGQRQRFRELRGAATSADAPTVHAVMESQPDEVSQAEVFGDPDSHMQPAVVPVPEAAADGGGGGGDGGGGEEQR